MASAASTAFIARFRGLHDRAKKGQLGRDERADYEATRREFEHMMLVAQSQGASNSGKTLRAGLRIAQLIKVEVSDGDWIEKTTTVDLASAGFGALLPIPQTVGRVVSFLLRLPAVGGQKVDPVGGKAKVTSNRKQGALNRVNFAFSEMDAESRERLDITLIDYLLARFNAPR